MDLRIRCNSYTGTGDVARACVAYRSLPLISVWMNKRSPATAKDWITRASALEQRLFNFYPFGQSNNFKSFIKMDNNISICCFTLKLPLLSPHNFFEAYKNFPEKLNYKTNWLKLKRNLEKFWRLISQRNILIFRTKLLQLMCLWRDNQSGLLKLVNKTFKNKL